jgi:hypothetical protein
MSNPDLAELATTQAQPDPYAPTLTAIWSIPILVQALRRFTCQSDFAALCLLSRKFHDRGNFLLYESATLCSQDKNDTRSIMAFYQTLITQTELARCVRSLRCVSLCPQKLLDNPDEESSHLSILPDLIKKLFRLEALYIVDWFPLSSQAVEELNQSLNFTPSLRHLGFNLEVPDWPNPLSKFYDINTSILKNALTLPSMKSLYRKTLLHQH